MLSVSVGENIFRPHRLAGILYHKEIVSFCYCHNTLHIGILSKKMYRYDSFCLRGDGSLEGFQIYTECVAVYIYEYRCKPKQSNYLCRGNECECRCYYLVACLESQCHKGYLQSIRAVGNGYDVPYGQVFFEIFLEIDDFTPFYERRGLDYRRYAGIYFLLYI